MSKTSNVVFSIFPFRRMWLSAREGGLKVGDVAPDFSLETYDLKSRVRLSAFRGKKPVVYASAINAPSAETARRKRCVPRFSPINALPAMQHNDLLFSLSLIKRGDVRRLGQLINDAIAYAPTCRKFPPLCGHVLTPSDASR